MTGYTQMQFQLRDALVLSSRRALHVGQRAGLCGVSSLKSDDHRIALDDRAMDGVIALRCASIRDAVSQRRCDQTCTADCADAERVSVEIDM